MSYKIFLTGDPTVTNHYHALVEHMHNLFCAYNKIKETANVICDKGRLQTYLDFCKIPFTVVMDNNGYENSQTYDLPERPRCKHITKEYINHIQQIATDCNKEKIFNNKIVIQRKYNRRIDDVTMNFLKQNGYKEYVLEDMPLQEQARLFNSASHVVCVHGSAIANMLFCNSNVRFIELNTGYNAYCFQELAKHIFNNGGLFINHHILLPNEFKHGLTPCNIGNIPYYHSYNGRLIKTGIEQYHIISNTTVFQNRANKDPQYVSVDITKLSNLI